MINMVKFRLEGKVVKCFPMKVFLFMIYINTFESLTPYLLPSISPRNHKGGCFENVFYEHLGFCLLIYVLNGSARPSLQSI